MKKICSVFIVVMCAFLLTNVSLAASVVSDNVVHMSTNKSGKYYAQAYFNPSHKVEMGEGYSLTVGKYVNRAYVRARSDGSWLCGSADTGRMYSIKATSKTNKIISTPQATVSKCAFCKQRTNYDWFYF